MMRLPLEKWIERYSYIEPMSWCSLYCRSDWTVCLDGGKPYIEFEDDVDAVAFMLAML